MSDVALSSPLPVRRIKPNTRVPAVAVSERRITRLEQLPPHLRQKAETLPPYLLTKGAEELSGKGRSKLYEAASEGRVRCVKDGATTLWETLSILLELANLPAAVIMPKAQLAPRRSPGRPRKSVSDQSTATQPEAAA
jgi:hypothetical protein